MLQYYYPTDKFTNTYRSLYIRIGNAVSENPNAPDPSPPQSILENLWQRFTGVNVSQIDALLYVGGEFTPRQWQTLAHMGIQAVLSLQAERADTFSEPLPKRTLRLPVPDWHPPTLEQLAEGVSFIRAAHAAELPVLVHCQAGMGRAPTTAAAYLVAEQGMSASAALSYIRSRRPIITPSPDQVARLREWERQVRGAAAGG